MSLMLSEATSQARLRGVLPPSPRSLPLTWRFWAVGRRHRDQVEKLVSSLPLSCCQRRVLVHLCVRLPVAMSYQPLMQWLCLSQLVA